MLEILTSKILNISPEYLHGIRKLIQDNLNGHIPLSPDQLRKRRSFHSLASHGFRNEVITSDSPDGNTIEESNSNDSFINVICVYGPITRNGDACSYGSKEHRDQMIQASKDSRCIGHIIMIDSPGGSAFSKHDYSQGIQAAHDAGQPVISLVDGLCYSAALALSCQCDETYYSHGADLFGCIGTMAAFYTQSNGSHNQYTDETYRELYDPESFQKNQDIRELAENGDDTKLLEELAEDGREFRELVKLHRPKVEEIHLHGATFRASEVEGILNDGPGDFESCVRRILTHSRPSISPISTSTSVQPIHTKNMKQYQNINTVLELEELPVGSDGSFFCNGPLAEKLNEVLGEYLSTKDLFAASNESVTRLNAELKKSRSEIERLQSENLHLSEENKQHLQSISDISDKLESLEKDFSQLESKAQSLEDTIVQQKESLSKKEEEIAELANKSKPAPVPPTTDSGTGSKSPDLRPHTIYTPGMSAKEMREANQRRLRELSRR